MKIKIIDASVAIKWFVQEPGRGSALEILDEIKDSPKAFAVPELFYSEMLSVLCRLLNKTHTIQEYLEILQELGWMRLENGRQTLHTAVELVTKHGLRGYDAIYAANAKLTKGTWLTADHHAHSKIAHLNLSSLIS